MKTVLDVFVKFNKLDFINFRFGSKHNAIRFYLADRCLLVYLAVNHFEVLSKPEGCGQKWQNKSVGAQFFTQPDSGVFVLRAATTK